MDAHPKRDLSTERAQLLRQIPSVDELLNGARLSSLSRSVDRQFVVEVTRAALAELRERITGAHPIRILPLRREEIESAIAGAIEKHFFFSPLSLFKTTRGIFFTQLRPPPPLPPPAAEKYPSAT